MIYVQSTTKDAYMARDFDKEPIVVDVTIRLYIYEDAQNAAQRILDAANNEAENLLTNLTEDFGGSALGDITVQRIE
jgi:hypothetical protein